MLTLLEFLWKDIRHDWGRSALNIFGLAVLIFSFMLLNALAGVLSDLLQEPGTSRNLVVIQADTIDPSDSTIAPDVFLAARELIPGLVSGVSPMTFRHTRIDDRLVQLRATPLEDWQSIHHLVLVEGTWPSPGSLEIAVGEGTARASNWQVGMQLHIYGSDFRITGVFRSPGINFASVWMPQESAALLFGEQRSSQLMVVQVAGMADSEVVRQRLQTDARLAGGYGVYYEDNYTRNNNLAIRDLSSLLTMVSWLALLAVSLGTYNATSLSLIERQRTIGILRVIGFSPRVVGLLLLLRALFQGMAAFGVGWCAAQVYLVYQHAQAPLFILGVPLEFEISWQAVTTGFVLTGVLVILGTWLSTHKQLSFSIAAALGETQ